MDVYMLLRGVSIVTEQQLWGIVDHITGLKLAINTSC